MNYFKYLFIFFLAVLTFTKVVSQISTQHLQLWLAADTGVIITAGKVSQWNDISGNNFHVTQTTENARPLQIENSLGGKPVIRFDGVDDNMIVNFSSTYIQPNTFFIVWKSLKPITSSSTAFSINSTNSNGLYAATNNRTVVNAGTNLIGTSSLISSNYVVHSWNMNGSTSKIYENNQLKISGNCGSNGVSRLWIGELTGFASYRFKGDIAEIIFYDTILADTNRVKVENYLMDKYANIYLGEDICANTTDTILRIDALFTDILWSTGDTTNSITINQSGRYWVRATDVFGRIQSDTINVGLIAFAIGDKNICFGDTAIFSVNLSGAYNYLWSTLSINDSISLTQDGEYWLKVSDTIGCSYTKYFNLAIDSFPVNVSLGNDTVICIGNKIGLVQGADQVVSYEWLPGSYNGPELYIYSSGQYRVNVMNGNSCEGSDSIYISIKGVAPTPHFSVQNFCLGDSTFFTDFSQHPDSIALYNWIFPGNDTINTPSPAYKFGNYGTQNISLLLESHGGCIKDTSFSIEILETPLLIFTTNPACSNTTIEFIPEIITPTGQYLTNKAWYIDNSFVSDDDTLRHIFNDVENYLLTFEVTSNNSCVVRFSDTLVIKGITPSPNFLVENFCLGDSTAFTNLSLPIDSIVSNKWLISGQDTLSVQNPQYLFDSFGLKNIKLIVETYSGCIKDTSFTIEIYDIPSVEITNTLPVCTNILSEYIADINIPQGQNIMQQSWFINNIFYSDSDTINYLFNISGDYEIKLEVVSDKNCIAFTQDTITVMDNYPSPSQFSLEYPFNNDVLINSIVNFQWSLSQNAYYYEIILSNNTDFSDTIFTKNKIFSNNIDISLPNDISSAFWKVNAYNPCVIFNSSDINYFSIFQPSDLSNLHVWYCADTGIVETNGKISKWSDRSGNSIDALQNTIANSPVFLENELNNLPVVYFNGNQYLTAFFNDTIIRPNTFFVVWKPDVIQTTNIVFDGVESSFRNWYGYNTSNTYLNNTVTNSIVPLQYNIATCIYNGANSSYYENSILIRQGFSTGTSQLSGLTIGARQGGTLRMVGKIAELIMYDSLLSASDRIKVEDYLRRKYAPPVYLGRDIEVLYGFCDVLLDAGSRFTNYLWNTGDTTQTLNVTQSGNYSVTVTDIFGYQSSDTLMVDIPAIANQNTQYCLGDTLNFSVNLGNDYTYLWLPDSITTADFSVTQPGTYSLTVYDTIGCQRTQIYNVVADSFPVLAGLGPDRSICQGDHIGLVNGAQQAISYLWSDNSGNSFLPINSPPGTTPVYAVTVTNINGCIARDTIVLTVNGVMPVVSFTYDSACFGNETHFTDLSSVPPPFSIATRLWDFGDSASSMIQNPAHVYPDDGIFNVQLTVVTDSGCTKTIQKDVTVFSVPDVSFLPFMGCSGVTVSFEDNTLCPYGNLTEWHWDFGDTYGSGNDTSGIQNPVYTYDSSGSYTVKLFTVSDAGCSDSAAQSITIRQSAAVNFQYTTACAGHLVYFTDQTVLPPWETITEFEWQFGDGTSSSISNPSHPYDTEGIYNVTLTIKTLNGCKVTLTKPVIIGAIPEASFGYTGSCIYTTAQFADSSTSTLGNIDHWSWNFGGIGASTDQHPAFVFPDTGIYNVTLKINTEYGCSDSAVVPVRVYPAPVAGFSLTPEYGIPPLPVSFTNLSTGANTYLWNFGDGDTDFSTDPVHTYLSQGIFDVLLTAYNITGCYDTVSHKVYVLPTTVDIEVLNTSCVIDGNILRLSADLLNSGSRKIEHIDVSMQLENGNIMHEHWYGALMQGQIIHYIFNAQPEVPAGQNVDYVCVTASLAPELEEDDLSDNKNCAVLNGNFTFSDPYPNPVINNLVLEYVLPFTDVVAIELFTEMGEKVKELYRGEQPEGYNAHTFDLSALNAGVYIVKITFHDNVLRKKFVKM
ncbi:MAG TPA: PKD domain-containing protein [Bacteroidales bacterium]|nr:PKD domain-containing protein [Bacteroidales bacterium]